MVRGDWRYLAKNLVTGEWLDTNLELRNVEVSEDLSGPGGVNGSIAPELRSATRNGERMFQEWQTMIVAEAAGEVRGCGILVHSEPDDDTQRWNLEAPGFTSYLHGIPYEGPDWKRWRVDPFDAVRHMVDWVQAQPDGNIDLQVSDAVSAVRIGDAQPPPRPTTSAQALRVPVKGAMPVQGAEETELDYLARVEAWNDAYAAAVAVYKAAKKEADSAAEALRAAQSEWDTQYRDKKPYELVWYESIDCGDELDRLASEVPFDYKERHLWNADKSEVLHFLDLGQPSIGNRRNDLRFAVGENVIVVPPPEFDGDAFAQNVLALGKGDGVKMLRSNVGKRDGRLRRVKVAPYKDVGYAARLRALADSELRASSGVLELTELIVVDHENARLGSWSVGDEIFIHAGGNGWFSTDMWVRIVSTKINPDQDDRIILTVVNSERLAS